MKLCKEYRATSFNRAMIVAAESWDSHIEITKPGKVFEMKEFCEASNEQTAAWTC